MCKNLKVLELPKLSNTLSTEENLKNLPRLDLDVLKIYKGCGYALKLLQASCTRHFSFYNLKNCDRVVIYNFLKVQKHLETLIVSGHYCRDSKLELFDTDALNSVDFHLKCFTLSNTKVENIENLTKFIENHADTLTHVELSECASPSILKSLKNVTKIKKLVLNTFRWSEVNDDCDVRENVEELSINTPIAFDLAVKFPSLTKIKVQLIKSDAQNLKLGKFEKLTNLNVVGNLTGICTKVQLNKNEAQNLNLRGPMVNKLPNLVGNSSGDCTIHDLTISASTKSISFYRYKFAAMPHFEHFQFDEIELIRCKNVDWLTEFLAKDGARVKKLKIKSLEMSSKVLDAMTMNGFKIEKLESKDIKFL